MWKKPKLLILPMQWVVQTWCMLVCVYMSAYIYMICLYSGWIQHTLMLFFQIMCVNELPQKVLQYMYSTSKSATLWVDCFTRTLNSWYLCKSAMECIYQKNNLCCTESMLTVVQRRSILQIREYCNISIFFQSMKVRKGLSNRGILSGGNQY